MITVICPRCGRVLHAREKHVLDSGGVPCLKCKVRIPVFMGKTEACSIMEAVQTETAPQLIESPALSAESPVLTAEPVIMAMADELPAGSRPEAGAEMTVTPPESVEQLRNELEAAKENAIAAEEILNRFSREKIASELALLRKNRDTEARCRDLAGKLMRRDDEASGLREQNAVLSGRLEAMQKQADELSSRLAAKTAEYQDVVSRKEAEKKDEMAALQTQVQTLEKQAGDLTFLLTARTGEFRRVIDQKEGEIESWRNKTQALESQARDLSVSLEAKIRENQALISSKETETEALLVQVLELESKVKTLERTLEGKEESLQTTLSGKDEEIRSLLARISEREEQSYKLAIALKGWEDRMRDIADKEGQLKALYDSLETDLKKEIDTHQRLLVHLRRQVQAA